LQDPNAKYLALETLSRLALVPDILEAIRHHQATVVESLKVCSWFQLHRADNSCCLPKGSHTAVHHYYWCNRQQGQLYRGVVEVQAKTQGPRFKEGVVIS
jgi:hypothetical protein